MTSFQDPLPPPPPPPTPAGGKPSDSSCRMDRILASMTEAVLSWCTRGQQKNVISRVKDLGVHAPAFNSLIIFPATIAFATAIGCCTFMLLNSKADVIVNLLGFVYPALATNTSETTTGCEDRNAPLAYAGYWVLFGMYAALDNILPVFTPFYFSVKACVLAWGASSARPYGGRRFLRHIFFSLKDDDDGDDDSIVNIVSAIKLQARIVEETGMLLALPPNAARLVWSTVLVAAGTIALGICCWSISIAEACFSDRLPRWLQNGVCVLVGALGPLLATSIALRRADAVRIGKHGSATDERQGPAAVQWLSYWPMFAFFQVFVDPVLWWIPHYFSIKLVALAVLASSHTRGAYLITSRFLVGLLVGRDENVHRMDQVEVVEGTEEETTTADVIVSSD